MFSVASCPRCTAQVLLPEGATPAHHVRCPFCQREYSLNEIFAKLPPALVLIETPVAHDPLAQEAFAHDPLGHDPLAHDPLTHAAPWDAPHGEQAHKVAPGEVDFGPAESHPLAGSHSPAEEHAGNGHAGLEAPALDFDESEHLARAAEEEFASHYQAPPADAREPLAAHEPAGAAHDDLGDHLGAGESSSDLNLDAPDALHFAETEPLEFEEHLSFGEADAGHEHALTAFEEPAAPAPSAESAHDHLPPAETPHAEMLHDELSHAASFGESAGEADPLMFPGEPGADLLSGHFEHGEQHASEHGGEGHGAFEPADEANPFAPGEDDEAFKHEEEFGPIEGFEDTAPVDEPRHISSLRAAGEHMLPAGEDHGEELTFAPIMPTPAHDEAEAEPKAKKGKDAAKAKAAKSAKTPKKRSRKSLVFTLLFLVFGGGAAVVCSYLAALQFLGAKADFLHVAWLLPKGLAPQPDRVVAQAAPAPRSAPPADSSQANNTPADEGANPAKEPEMPAEEKPAAAESNPLAGLDKPGEEMKPADPFAPEKNALETSDPLEDLLNPRKAVDASKTPVTLDETPATKPADGLAGNDPFALPGTEPKAGSSADMPLDPLAPKGGVDPFPTTPDATDPLAEKPVNILMPAEKPAENKPSIEDDVLGAAATKPANKEDLLAPEPKIVGKTALDEDPLMALDKPAPKPAPEEPIAEPAPAPIAPRNAASYPTDQIAAALKEAAESDAQMSEPDRIPATDLKRAKARYRLRLYRLGETITNPARDADPLELSDQKAAAMKLLEETAKNPGKMEMIDGAASRWISFKDREKPSGITLIGTVTKIASHGPLFEQQVAVTGDTEPLSIFSAAKPTGAVGERVLMMGSVVDDPAANLPGYTGSQPAVIWNGGMTLTLPAGGSG